MSSFAMRSVALLSALCGGLYLGTALATAGPKLDPRAAAKDPRSGAALNREAAKKRQRPAQPPLFPLPYRIGKSAVNDAGADTTAQDTQSETTVVDLGGGNLVAAFNDSGSFLGGAAHFTGYAFSSNNGKSWTDAGTLPASVEGDAGDPVLASDKTSGAVFMATLGFNTGNNIQVFKSTDFGHTFGAPVNGTPGATLGDFQDKEWIAVDNFDGAGQSNVYLCWTRFGATEDILFTRSTNGGASFGPSGGTLISPGGQGCFVVVSPNHNVHVFYYRGTGGGGQGGDNKLFTRRSSNQGVTFAPEVQVADLATTSTNGDLGLNGGLRSNSFPHAAVNPNPAQPTLVAVYNDDPNLASSADNGDIFFVVSTDGGATWSAPRTVNDDKSGDQFFPTVAFAGGDRLMFSYYSRSQDPSNLVFHRRARLAQLKGAGGVDLVARSFQLSPNTPVVIGQDPVINPTYMGDYDQIAGGSDVFSTTWSDNRHGNSFHLRQPDVRSAQIAAVPSVSDIAVSVSPSPMNIDLGQDTDITVSVAATGGTATDVFLNMPLTNGLAIQSVNHSGGTQCNLINGFVGCSLGSIAGGTSKSVDIIATGVSEGARVVTASATTSSRKDSPANNSDSATVVVSTGSAVVETFSTGDVAIPLPDVATTEIPLTIPATGTLVNIKARVRLNHTFDSDLAIFLVSPAGEVVELSTNNGGSGDNYGSGLNSCAGTPTVFSDGAAVSIAGAAAPFAGSFKPEQPLADLLPTPSDGTWKLRVIDQAFRDSGTLGCFKLTITRVP